MKYRIRDLQFECRYFADGAVFNSKEEILEQLISYHDIDFIGVDKDDNELTIEEYFKFYKIDTFEKQLEWILDYGEWEIEEAI